LDELQIRKETVFINELEGEWFNLIKSCRRDKLPSGHKRRILDYFKYQKKKGFKKIEKMYNSCKTD
jgi:hypothetical protein